MDNELFLTTVDIDPLTIIKISSTDGLQYIRRILEQNNQQVYFELHKNVPPVQLQIFGTTMLFCSLEQNSDLVYGSLKHLNAVHKFYPDTRFHYNKQLLEHIRFNSWADNYSENFLMTLYTCAELSFNGARTEALEFFKYWIQDENVALDVFSKICFTWPWTNRNKYYLLALLFECHNFYHLLRQSDIEPTYFVRGVVISLQYRNLISPGQSLMVLLTKLNVTEAFDVIAEVLRSAIDFELYNCVQWLHCLFHLDCLYDRLDLSNETVLSDKKFGYLLESNMDKLVLFRRAFKASFEHHPKVREIDHFIVSNYRTVGLVHRAAIFEVLITNTMTRLDTIEANLEQLQNFLKDNMRHEHSALRQDIMKLMPNLFYLLTSLLKTAPDELKANIKSFFRFLKLQIFDVGIEQEQYQPQIFSLRLYEILMKLLFGRREDRLIKEFNVDKNNRLKAFLIDEHVWDPCSTEHYNVLIGLVQSDFDDVRDISSELLVRFFPTNASGNMYYKLMTSSDINQCRYSHLFARIAMQNDELQLYSTLKEFLRFEESDYDDPFRKSMTGHHLFGAVNCLNEFYCSRKNMSTSPKERKSNLSKDPMADVTVAERISNHFLRLLKIACCDATKNGSASFEKMDESLEILLSGSSQPVTDIYEDKKFLLLSIWLTLKACCELASNITACSLDKSSQSNENDHSSQVEILTKCLNVASNVLLQCRHKGAIEASGLALGKIVKSITLKCGANTKMFEIVTSCVGKIFDVIDKTDTTRRGAGFSIMVLHLVKNDGSKDKTIVKHVMDILLEKYDLAVQLQQEQQNRDNLQASILHFFCVLFKDGDLKSTLSGYMVKVFSIAIAMIESSEWTIRNAALQLFGAIVPKLVGQSQYFINPKISWEPVNTAYNDIIAKMIGIHQHVQLVLNDHRFVDKSSVLLVSVLELLSRVEVIGQLDDIRVLRAHFFTMIGFDSEKIRNLAAKSLARFHEFNEIREIVDHLLPQLFRATSENRKHGIVISVLYLLQKHESDVRFTGNALHSSDLFSHARTLLLNHFEELNSSYYVRCYLLNLLQFIGFDIFDKLVLKIIFECETVTSREDVEKHLVHLDARCEYNEFGFDLWKQKVQNVYLNCELREEWEI